jgi:predicted GTPase
MVESTDQQSADRIFTLTRLNELLKVPAEFKPALNAAIMAGKQELARRYKVICVLGVTGHGKSMTCNTICGKKVFNVSAFTESETDTFSGLITRWRNLNGENPYIVFDTPGIGDS